MDHFIGAGRDFCAITGFSFDDESYAKSLQEILDAENSIVVTGDGCHCVAMLVPSLYDSRETIARVFSTWGRGGLRCFREVERIAKERGARYMIADQMYDKRIGSFYRRIGMREADTTYIKEL